MAKPRGSLPKFGPTPRRPMRIKPKTTEVREAGSRRQVMPVVLHHKRERIEARRNA